MHPFSVESGEWCERALLITFGGTPQPALGIVGPPGVDEVLYGLASVFLLPPSCISVAFRIRGPAVLVSLMYIARDFEHFHIVLKHCRQTAFGS